MTTTQAPTQEFLLPDVGEGLTEAEIVEWKVAVGDVIAINDIIVEIETAKSLVELPSPYAGTVLALMVDAGVTVDVGTPIIRVGDPASTGPSTGPSTGEPAPGPAAAAPQPEMAIDLSNPAASGGGEGESLVGRNKAERGPVRRARKGSASPSTEAGANTQMQLQGAFAPGGAESDEVVASDEPAVPATPAPPVPEPVDALVPARATDPAAVRALAKPPVRKLAKDLGVDLAACRASGPGGTVTRDDVHAAAGRGAAPEQVPAAMPATTSASTPRPAAAGGARETREPVKGVRKMMAGAMVGSAFSAPHVTEWVTVDVTRTMELVERLKDHRDLRGLKVSPLLVLARACVLAMRRTPVINSTWDEAAQEVVLKHYVNLGIAAATPRGLVVPNVKDAHDLALPELAAALGELTATAREGRTQPAEMAGGTFTITNVGVFGVDAGTPIINPGESAILCFGAVTKKPWVVTRDGVDEIVVRQVTTLALSFDHRHVDGQAGSQFLADVASILEDPASALLF
ncbi:dihydrolipoamide acetyltransferase family protein [Nocardioides sp. P86]|uniref:dihydrolipoamide acetyltransferase family protein n=2 Tax=Nocardioides TaxID=1839 RepID=UPI00204105E0|nr:dihydrolipoamide acetyltransferase family protein [Nocardioides sp. P86]MCM3516279.1 2-oxo acid dehydrogenase subunit E2 [Nocardioides sp. P86]